MNSTDAFLNCLVSRRPSVGIFSWTDEECFLESSFFGLIFPDEPEADSRIMENRQKGGS